MIEMIVDNFAGGGGASHGIEKAIGRPIDIAINHDREAIALHQANHPNTRHYCEDVWQVDPVEVTQGRPVGLAWFSPDCKHFSRAKGGKPVAKKIRGLAWVAIRWAKAVRPRVIMLENVSEFATWGPLLADGTPCQVRRGATFRKWCRKLEKLGYRLDMREMSACDYGAPTTRRRLFIIARCDGQPIVWPEETHGPGLAPYRTAADCLDFTLPCPSIFDRKKPLADATIRRIARGIQRYVVNTAKPFVVTMRGTGDAHIASSARAIDEPLRTTSAGGTHHAVVTPVIVPLTHAGERRAHPCAEPMPTVTGAHRGEIAMVTAFLAKHYGGHENDGCAVTAPMHTVTAIDHHAMVYAFLVKYYGTDQNPRLDGPLGTVTTRDRFGLVTVKGTKYQIVDIGMRMLTPRELYNAQSFPRDYKIDPVVAGKVLSKTAQVRMAGNSVCPVMSEALVRANLVAVEQHQAA